MSPSSRRPRRQQPAMIGPKLSWASPQVARALAAFLSRHPIFYVFHCATLGVIAARPSARTRRFMCCRVGGVERHGRARRHSRRASLPCECHASCATICACFVRMRHAHQWRLPADASTRLARRYHFGSCIRPSGTNGKCICPQTFNPMLGKLHTGIEPQCLGLLCPCAVVPRTEPCPKPYRGHALS